MCEKCSLPTGSNPRRSTSSSTSKGPAAEYRLAEKTVTVNRLPGVCGAGAAEGLQRDRSWGVSVLLMADIARAGGCGPCRCCASI